MAERKAVNKYYPPDWEPSKGSINKYRGSHPLRERARKLNQGILIIRFELPYNIWCDGCGNHIGTGVRYNAEKTKVGMYYTTPIYKFRMKCHLCDNKFEIKTDPQNLDYETISGARRQERRWDPTENEQIVPEDKNDSKKLASDSMFKLEHGMDDHIKSKNAAPRIGQIAELQTRWKDDYSYNKIFRQQFRERKKQLRQLADKDKALLNKASLDISLVPEHQDDVKLAALFKHSTVVTYDEKQKQKREEIDARPILPLSLKSIVPAVSDKPLSRLETKKKTSETIIKKKQENCVKSMTTVDLGITFVKKTTDELKDCNFLAGQNISNSPEHFKTAKEISNNICSSLVSQAYSSTDDDCDKK